MEQLGIWEMVLLIGHLLLKRVWKTDSILRTTVIESARSNYKVCCLCATLLEAWCRLSMHVCCGTAQTLPSLSFCSSGFPQAKSTHNALLSCQRIQAPWNHFLSLPFLFFSFYFIVHYRTFFCLFLSIYIFIFRGPHLFTSHRDIISIISA